LGPGKEQKALPPGQQQALPPAEPAALPPAQGTAGPRRAAETGAPPAERGAFTATQEGIVLEPGRDYNLVPTAGPTPGAPDWLQIHQGHPHAGVAPHTHRAVVDPAPSGAASTRRVTSPTADVDIQEADRRLRSGELRPRRNRRDR